MPTAPFAPGLGLTDGTIRIANSNPDWPETYERLASDLRAALGDLAVAIEHVGSTSVPGLPAKPILDIAAGLAPGAPTEAVVAAITGLGYEDRGDKDDEGGLLFVLRSRPSYRIAHVHAVPHGDHRWDAYLAVRDRLREDAEARDAYGALKRRLAREHLNDRPAYGEAKTGFVRSLLSAPPAPAE